MQLTEESYRTKWLVLVSVWMIIGYSLLTQTRMVDLYLATANGLGLRGQPEATTPLKAAFPAFAADGQTWVRHAISLVEQEPTRLQLRYTTIDNAPEGREVHWNSAWAWTIAGAGRIHQLFTGKPLTTSIEIAALWLPPLAFFILIVGFSSWVSSKAGAIAGVFTAGAMLCQNRMYEGFFPTYVDHHGLLTVAVFGTVLGVIFMGSGWWQPRTAGKPSFLPGSEEAALRGAAFSAISGACGLWVSAASIIPPIAITGAAGLLSILIQGRHAQAKGAQFSARAWRLWGRYGAIGSFVFYIIEYFPGHLGLRLEVNHPFYALAWLGGGELIAQIGERWLAPREERFARLQQLIWPLVVVSFAPIAIVLGGAKVLSFLDPFMSNLHSIYIQEFLPLWRTMRFIDGQAKFQIIVVDTFPLLAGIATLSFLRRESSIVLWFATLAAGFLTLMAWLQSRWLLNASGGQVALALVVVVTWCASYRILFRWLIGLGVLSALYVPSGVMRYLNAKGDVEGRKVSPRDALNILDRDVAAAIRASQPEGEITLLCSPNGSTAVGYYGRFKTLGTLYWENAAGLKSAAAIWGAKSEDEAADLIKKYKVTHLALITEENFIAQYKQLLDPKASPEEIRNCFGNRIMIDKVVPRWLQMLPYAIPPDLTQLKVGVMLFKVNFDQSLGDAIYNVGLAQIASGEIESADKTFEVLTSQAPQLYQPWLRRAELHLARKNWDQAEQALLTGGNLAPAAERPTIFALAAENFYRLDQHAAAARCYRESLKARRTPEVLSYLSWILAASRFDAVRNGAEALSLANEAVKADPNSPTHLLSLAAACAELGRFPDAAAAAERAVTNAQIRGDAAGRSVAEQRLQLYRAGKIVRQ